MLFFCSENWINDNFFVAVDRNFNLYMQRFVRVRVNIFLENSDISTYRKLHVVPVNPNDREFIKNWDMHAFIENVNDK